MNYFDTVISYFDTIISVICAILTGIGAWYGRKAYLEARKIFNDGLKLNSDKVLSQVGYEFVYTFIIPYLEFSFSTKELWEIVPKSMSIKYVLELFKLRSNFRVDFQYWEKHKTDVWSFYNDGIAKEGYRNIYSADIDKYYRSINDFVNSAKEFLRLVEKLQGDLETYIKDNSDASLQDFINSNNENLLSFGKRQMDKVTLCINCLPGELLIKEWIAIQSGPNAVLIDWLRKLNAENI